jgi:AcrR family transcriptional regulator
LNRDTVLAAGLALADTDGLEGVSLRRIANRLGVTPMALYRHVEGKDDLLDGMADLMYAQLAVPRGARGWWEELAELAHSARRVALAHPAALELLVRPSGGPHARQLEEALSSTLQRAGFSAREAAELHEQLSAIVFALVRSEIGGRPNRARFGRGLDLLRDGLEARLRPHPGATTNITSST